MGEIILSFLKLFGIGGWLNSGFNPTHSILRRVFSKSQIILLLRFFTRKFDYVSIYCMVLTDSRHTTVPLYYYIIFGIIYLNEPADPKMCLSLLGRLYFSKAEQLWYRIREEQWAYIPCKQFSFCNYNVTHLYEKISQLLSFCFLFLLDFPELDIRQYIPVMCIFYGNRRESLKIFYHRLHFYSIIYPSTSIYRTLIVAGRIQKLY